MRHEYEKPTSVRMPPELQAYIRAVAAKQDRSLSFIIVDIVRRWVEWDKKRKHKREEDAA